MEMRGLRPWDAKQFPKSLGTVWESLRRVSGKCLESVNGRRTEQAKANLDPRVGPQVAPRVGPRVAPRAAPRVLPREHPRGLISLFSALKGLPTKHPTKVSTEGPTSGRSGFTCPVFTCSVLWPVKGRKKRIKQTFCGQKWAVWDPLVDPKLPAKKFVWIPFCVLSQEMRHIIFFFRGPKIGCLGGGGPKSLCWNILCAFSVP